MPSMSRWCLSLTMATRRHCYKHSLSLNCWYLSWSSNPSLHYLFSLFRRTWSRCDSLVGLFCFLSRVALWRFDSFLPAKRRLWTTMIQPNQPQNKYQARTFLGNICQWKRSPSIQCFCGNQSFILLVDSFSGCHDPLVPLHLGVALLCLFHVLDCFSFLSTRRLFCFRQFVFPLSHVSTQILQTSVWRRTILAFLYRSGSFFFCVFVEWKCAEGWWPPGRHLPFPTAKRKTASNLFSHCDCCRCDWSHCPVFLSGIMIIPVRCFTCGKVIGNKWETYLSLLQADFSEGWAELMIHHLLRQRMLTYLIFFGASQRCFGWAGFEAILLSKNDVNACGFDRETSELQHRERRGCRSPVIIKRRILVRK